MWLLVIDEADRDARTWASSPNVERIVGLHAEGAPDAVLLATMPPEIRRLGDAFLKEPGRDSVSRRPPAELFEQSLVVVAPEQKREALRALIGSEDVKNALIL